MEPKETTGAIAAPFASEPEIRLALVFGSLIEGRARFDSDVDVAVAAARPLDGGVKIRLVERLATLTGRPVDLIELQVADRLILSKALTTGKVVLCKDRTLLASLMRRMIFDQEDVMPYRHRVLAARREAWIRA